MVSAFESDIESRKQEMHELLDSINIDDLKANGVSLSFGGKTFKFSELEIVEDDTIEEKLGKEFKEKLNHQQQRIREKINSKINQLLLLHQQKQQEIDRKETELKKKYSDSAMMPDIKERHMIKGLSVVKGMSSNELIWIYRGVYNPKFLVQYNGYGSDRKTRKAIPTRLVNRMKKDILIIIKTKNNQITEVQTKKNQLSRGGLENFPHYHQTGSGDCWGSWKHPNSWKTPDDILNCAKDAEAVLEAINTGSIASRGPTGLPRLATLEKSVEDIDPHHEPETISEEDDVWHS